MITEISPSPAPDHPPPRPVPLSTLVLPARALDSGKSHHAKEPGTVAFHPHEAFGLFSGQLSQRIWALPVSSVCPVPHPAPLHLHPCPADQDEDWCLGEQRKDKSFQQNAGRSRGAWRPGCQDPVFSPPSVSLCFQREERERKEREREKRERENTKESLPLTPLATLALKAVSANMKIQFASLIRKV